ncbi:hypothetical protein AH4AK4_0228 [Aeromonas hydrophila 4AK4]|nr:hypothetical protein AH4AK4_0228 [Aeromonas hydrophila 4AK4]
MAGQTLSPPLAGTNAYHFSSKKPASRRLLALRGESRAARPG